MKYGRTYFYRVHRLNIDHNSSVHGMKENIITLFCLISLISLLMHQNEDLIKGSSSCLIPLFAVDICAISKIFFFPASMDIGFHLFGFKNYFLTIRALSNQQLVKDA